MLFGEKQLFAIDAEKSSKTDSFGLVQMHINGSTLGNWEERVPLNVVLNYLKRIINNPNIRFPDLSNKSPDEIFKILTDTGNDKYDSTIVSLGVSFEDCEIRVIQNDEELMFVWRLCDSPNFECEQTAYKIRSGNVPLQYFETVVAKFTKYLED